MDGTGSESFPVTSFGISSAEPTIDLVTIYEFCEEPVIKV